MCTWISSHHIHHPQNLGDTSSKETVSSDLSELEFLAVEEPNGLQMEEAVDCKRHLYNFQTALMHKTFDVYVTNPRAPAERRHRPGPSDSDP